ncbi:type II secretion system protein GspG [Lichenibacterium minor]|uniref:Type II secretion system core protein G n=2 Tax=Lichenibacterium minor TaxID=2316528 RepID=A0A4Q2UAQ2_9HYPH|nr:type II secretion system protein GspG [Lichenibacterium minor]
MDGRVSAGTGIALRDRAGRLRRVAVRTAGFTLVEMLVVLAIIGLLVGLVAPRVFGQLAEAKVRTAHIQIESFKNALDLFYLDAGRYPTTQEGLQALNTRPSNVASWGGPYVKGTNVPKDPWNRAYNYRAPGGNGRPYDITSDGPNGKGGEPDGANQIASY